MKLLLLGALTLFSVAMFASGNMYHMPMKTPMMAPMMYGGYGGGMGGGFGMGGGGTNILIIT